MILTWTPVFFVGYFLQVPSDHLSLNARELWRFFMDRILFGQEDGDSFSFLFLRKADMEGIVKNPSLLGLYFFQE